MRTVLCKIYSFYRREQQHHRHSHEVNRLTSSHRFARETRGVFRKEFRAIEEVTAAAKIRFVTKPTWSWLGCCWSVVSSNGEHKARSGTMDVLPGNLVRLNWSLNAIHRHLFIVSVVHNYFARPGRCLHFGKSLATQRSGRCRNVDRSEGSSRCTSRTEEFQRHNWALRLALHRLLRDLHRCIQTCRHVLDEHDENDAEALFSLAQALEALGLSEEARQCASRASSLLAAATR